MEINQLIVKKLREDAVIPEYMTPGSAAMDLYSCMPSDIVIGPGEKALVPTGIAVMIAAGYAGFIYARSGLAVKSGITLTNCVGVIDSDYRGEIRVALYNTSSAAFTVTRGMRIAQMVISKIEKPVIVVSDELDETKRGAGGFGSTGVS